MSRRYASQALSRKLAVEQAPYNILQEHKEEAWNDHAGQRWGARLGHQLGQETEAGWTSRRLAFPGQRIQQSELTQAAYDKMLALLDRDREAAAWKYEIIRRKLQKFFEYRGCPTPNDLADDTINLVARKIDQGQDVSGDEPARYFYGVARNMIRSAVDTPSELNRGRRGVL